MNGVFNTFFERNTFLLNYIVIFFYQNLTWLDSKQKPCFYKWGKITNVLMAIIINWVYSMMAIRFEAL